MDNLLLRGRRRAPGKAYFYLIRSKAGEILFSCADSDISLNQIPTARKIRDKKRWEKSSDQSEKFRINKEIG
ncbi:MAG: hypothetical protein PUH70_12975 [Clostridiales bacterium]|nr:hypothetical protein [Clostridiales bacterium]MDY5513413.1 hypothetical protein [Candidatus Ventricola sp.]